jgi:hypothetical protein
LSHSASLLCVCVYAFSVLGIFEIRPSDLFVQAGLEL